MLLHSSNFGGVCVTLLTRLERSPVNTVPYHSTGVVSAEEVT